MKPAGKACWRYFAKSGAFAKDPVSYFAKSGAFGRMTMFAFLKQFGKHKNQGKNKQLDELAQRVRMNLSNNY